MIELTDEIILKIDELLYNWNILILEIVSRIANNEENILNEYINDDILIEYYNGIKNGKTFPQMREICLPKYIRRELKQLKITK